MVEQWQNVVELYHGFYHGSIPFSWQLTMIDSTMGEKMVEKMVENNGRIFMVENMVETLQPSWQKTWQRIWQIVPLFYHKYGLFYFFFEKKNMSKILKVFEVYWGQFSIFFEGIYVKKINLLRSTFQVFCSDTTGQSFGSSKPHFSLKTHESMLVWQN